MTSPQNNEFDIISLIVTVVKFLRKNSVPILVITAIGILCSVSLGFTKSDIIESKMVLYSDILTKSYGEQIGRNLNNLIHEKGDNPLFKKLDISASDAAQIQSIDLEMIEEKSSKDLDIDKSTLIITAEVRNRAILPKLQDAILNYFRDNEFVSIRVKHRKDQYHKLIERIGREIQSLDSVKKLVVSGRSIPARSDIAFVDPSIINKTIVDLYTAQVKYQNALEVVDSIQLVEGFSSIAKPPRLKTTTTVLLGFLGGFGLSMLYLGVIWLIKNTKP